MTINYQDPLKEPYIRPSQKRYLRGTLARRTVTQLYFAFLTFSLGSGAAMIWGTSEERKQRWKGSLEQYGKWRGTQDAHVITDIGQEIDDELDAPTLDEEIADIFNPERLKLWKPSFWLDPIRQLYEGSGKTFKEELAEIEEMRDQHLERQAKLTEERAKRQSVSKSI